MDAISLIVDALTMGAAAEREDTATGAIKDASAGLRELVRRRFGGRETAETALAEHEKRPQEWAARLATELAVVSAETDARIIEAAQRVITLVETVSAASGKYLIDLSAARSVQVGDCTNQTNFNSFYIESRVEWPHQVGSVPMLADCYQDRMHRAGLDDSGNDAASTSTQVLSGLGGVGKTQLAAGYARRIWADKGVDLLVWATATSRTAVQATYAQAAAEIGQLPFQDVERAAEYFLGWLQNTHRAWLVVLDDLADPADLHRLWPMGPTGRTLITTRRRDVVLTERGRVIIDVGLYTPKEALAYIRSKLESVGGAEVMNEAAELATDLGYLPLALAQATTFIRDRGDTCAEYRRRFSDRHRRLSEVLPEDALADDYGSTVATTWSISLEHADRIPPVGMARSVLQLISTLDPNGIPLDIVTSPAARMVIAEQHGFSESRVPAAVSKQDCRDALTNLHRLNLISLEPMGGARAIRTHALVQRATLEKLSADVIVATVRAAADALAQVWPDIEKDTELGRVLRDCTAHLRQYHGRVLWEPQAHTVLFCNGHSLADCGLVGAAVSYWTEMVMQADSALGSDHPQTLMTRQSLARCRGQAGNPAGAVQDFEALLPDYFRVLGPDHPDTLTARHGLAWWRGEAKDMVGAVEDFVTILDDRSRVLGPDHPDTLITRYSLGRWRGQAGDSTGAMDEFKTLLPDSFRLMGADHRLTLAARHDLAWWIGEAGNPVAAANAFEALLTDRLRVMGPDHPHTLATRHDLAWWRGEAGDPGFAVAALEILLTDYQRVLGADHPHTLATRDDFVWWRDPDVRSIGGAYGQSSAGTDRIPGDLPGLDFLANR